MCSMALLFQRRRRQGHRLGVGQGVEIESRISKSGTNREQKGAEQGKGKDVEQQGSLMEARIINIRVAAAHTKLQVPPTHKLGGGGGGCPGRRYGGWLHECSQSS